MIRDATTQAGWISLVLGERDGAYAMDTLREWAGRDDAPDLARAERELVERHDPLCDLAVATYGRDAPSVATIYRRADSLGLRLAVLANSYYRATGWAGSVLDENEASTLLASATGDEIFAFFANPRLSADGLLDVLLQRGPAAALTGQHAAWPMIFAGLAANSALGDLFDTRQVLPSAAARYQMNAALRHCLLTVATTLDMGVAVGEFLVALLDERAPGAHFPAENLPQLVLAWHPSVATDATSHPFFKVQMLLSILYGYPEEDARGHAFPSVRASAMARSPLGSEKDLEDLYASDNAAFFAGMPYSRDLFEEPAIASRFVSLAAVNNDTALALYLQRQAKLDEQWGLNRPATVRDLQSLRSLVLRRPGSTMSDSDAERLRQLLAPPGKTGSARSSGAQEAPWWKYWGLAILVGLALFLIFRLMEADAIEQVRMGTH